MFRVPNITKPQKTSLMVPSIDEGTHTKVGLQFTQDESTDMSLKHNFGSLKYKAQHNQRFNNAWHYTARYWKKNLRVLNVIWFHNQLMKLKSPQNLVIHLQFSLNIHGHTILPIRHSSHKRLQESVLSDHSLYMKPINLRYLQPDDRTTRYQSIQSGCKIMYAYDSKKKHPCQYSKHYQLFYTVNPVQEIHCDWSTLQRREILRSSRPMHWLDT